MKLSKLALEFLNEDTWGNNPSTAGSMSPGKTPNTVSPAGSPNVKFYNVEKDFQKFEHIIDSEEQKARLDLKNTLSQALQNKKIAAKASKGAVGQVEKIYPIDVIGADVVYLSDKYYIVLKGADKKDYYVNTGFQIKILGPGEKNTKPEQGTPTTPSTGNQPFKTGPQSTNPNLVSQPPQ